jgi:hypothetical protein
MVFETIASTGSATSPRLFESRFQRSVILALPASESQLQVNKFVIGNNWIGKINGKIRFLMPPTDE